MKGICLMVVATAALADVSYDSTTQITGGMLVQMANMPIMGGKIKEALKPQTSKTALKGDRLIYRYPNQATIIDVDKETFTNIDYNEKTYTVATFAEMKAQFEKAMQDMNAKMKDKKQDVDMKMEFDLKETGNSSSVEGLPFKELLLTTKTVATDPQTGRTGEFVMNDVMCMAKDVPGSEEVRAFHKKMAEKLQFDPAAFQSQAGGGFFGQSLSQMQKRAQLMDGMPILQYITIGANADTLPATLEAAQSQASSAQAQAQQPAGPSKKDIMGAAAGSALGRFGGFGRGKKDAPPPATEQASTTAPAGAGALMQMKIAETGFSTGSVDGSIFDVPADFKKVDFQMGKRPR